MSETKGFLCPVCYAKGREEKLTSAEHTYFCPQRHSFDRAKSGYVNLLLPSDKHSKLPGDNQLMAAARQKFLDKGYYRPLADSVGHYLINRLCDKTKQPVSILDMGCGEGYYTSYIQKMLAEQEVNAHLFGVDISKFALDKAAKRNKQVEFAVGSIFHLPMETDSCDVLLNLFAPHCAKEAQRVLHKDGIWVMVIPGERHLIELKNAVYDEPYANDVKDNALDGFVLAEQKHLEYTMNLQTGEDIVNLFMMTPYYYKTSQENQQRLLALTSLTVTASFEILVYKR